MSAKDVKEGLTTGVRKRTWWRGLAYGLFWSWNLIFLAFMFLGFAPQMLPLMIAAVRSGQIPAVFLACAAVMTAIPAAAVVVGLTLLRRSPGRLLALGYGVEGPLMLVLAVRFLVVRQAVWAFTLLLVIAGLGMATLLWQLFDPDLEARRPGWGHLRTAGLTLLLLTGLYAGVWIAFYAPPAAVAGWQGVRDMLRYPPELRWVPLWLLGTLLLVYTGTLLVAMPVVVPVLYVRAWWRGARALAGRYGRLRAALLTLVVVAVCAALFVQANRQPQGRAFALLKNPPATPDEARALLERQEAIRAGLLNAYLAPVRYVSTLGGVRHVSDMYEQTIGVSRQTAGTIQQLYEVVARPLLYVPADTPVTGGRADQQALRDEPPKAARLYKEFFDRSIVEGERKEIVRAVRSTWSIDQAQAAWQAVDDREVHLVRQEVSVAEHGDWAEGELYEVYQNQTGQRQEVVYYFSLPESAVVTGLWLGNSPERAERFAYRVAPRGAAQAVYRNEVRYNRDPALMEQIGPRQYRLRIFPVEPQQVRWEEGSVRSTVVEGPPLYMWLTWRVLAGEDGWPLPRLAEKRNVYWDVMSDRLVNGELLADGEEEWLPAAVPVIAPAKPVAHRVDFPGGETVIARPVQAADLLQLPGDLRLAVVLDRSRSMEEQAAEVQVALARLADVAAGLAEVGAAVDVYLTASPYRGEEASLVSLDYLEPGSLWYVGGQNAVELLGQFDALHTGQRYDAIFVLTDGSGYELGDGGVQVRVPGAPVWMVHVGGAFPLGYDDATLEAIQASGGGVAGDVTEALTRLAVAREGTRGGASSYDVVDGYVWITVPTEAADAEVAPGAAVEADSEGFAALAARRLILAAMQRERGGLGQLEALDRLHAIAVEQGIVTPYSSMIVLVNERQEQLLDELEERADRFQREAEEVGETTQQSPFAVTGVPEPEEWLLLAVAAGMLGWYVWTRRGVPEASARC